MVRNTLDSDRTVRCDPVGCNEENEAFGYRTWSPPPRAAARLVRPPSPAVAVAAAGGRGRRSLSGVALRNHAAANRGQNGWAILRKIHRALAGCRGARPCLAR